MLRKACLLLLVLCFSTGLVAESEDIRVRSSQWAQPLLGDDLDNCFKVSEQLYRCGQPNRKAFNALQKFGIKEVLNLREYHSDKGRAGEGLALHRLKWDTGDVTQQDLIEALLIIKEAKGPLLVHCWHGADRTGTLIAAYRIVFQGWAKQAAIDEMVNGGFGYHSMYDNLLDLLQQMDVEQVQKSINEGPQIGQSF